LNSSRLRQRIQIDGDKFFAKLPAAGPETSKIIHGIRRSRSVKWIKKLEFDPYLCDHSHLNDLRKICYKIRDISGLNLVIRRVDFPHEIETITPFVSRFLRLRSFRVEFPRTENIDENGLTELYKAIGNCSHLRSLEWKAIEMPERSPRFSRVSHNANQCLRWVKNVKLYETLKKGAFRNHATQPEKPEKPVKNRKIRRNIANNNKTLDIVFASPGEWENKQTIDQEKIMDFLKIIALVMLGLEKLRTLTIKKYTNFEEILNSFKIIALVPTLFHLESEYLNCQLSDMEVLAFAQGLLKAKQLKYFSLKVIQKPGISEDCIIELANFLSRLENLTKFDFYFRRLGFHPQAIRDLGSRIESFGNIQCCCSKESIHIYRRSNDLQ